MIAPPTFVVAAALWNPRGGFRGVRKIPVVPPAEASPARGEGRGANIARVLHGEMRFEYHQPIRPGMTLAVSERPGRRWEKEGRRGGMMRFSETITEYRDERGDLVVTSISVGILTEKAVE